MSVKSRVRKLEREDAALHAPQGWLPENWNWESEWQRWVDEEAALAELVDEPAFNLLDSLLLQQFRDLERLLLAPYNGDAYRQKALPEHRRWPKVIRTLVERIPADLRAKAITADYLTGHPGSRNRWLGDSLRNLAWLRCYVPPDVSADTMRALITAYTDQSNKLDDFRLACIDCGLSRPRLEAPPYSEWAQYVRSLPGEPMRYELPELFRNCPHCGSSEWMWEHRMSEKDYPWRALAMKEYDPAE